MAFDISKILVKFFGSRNERMVKSYSTVSTEALEFEEQVKKLSDEELKAKTTEFKATLQGGVSAESILPEAFAVVRETAWYRNSDLCQRQLSRGCALADDDALSVDDR